jgi:hypothetical protein
MKKYLTGEEVEKRDSQLHQDIENYINENIANWGEQCSCEEEGEALEFFLDRHLPSWRVRRDGTIDVIIKEKSRKSFNFEWEDEEGEEQTSNALDLLKGCVSHKFDEECNNETSWDKTLGKRIIEVFKPKSQRVQIEKESSWDYEKYCLGEKVKAAHNNMIDAYYKEHSKTCPDCGSVMLKVCMCKL